MWRVLLLSGILGFGASAWADERAAMPRGTTILVAESLTLRPARSVRPDPEADGVLVIETDGVTLDLGGATLVGTADDTATPDQFTGVAVHVRGAKDVTIKNGRLRGYKIGIRAEDAAGLTILGVDASGNFRQRLRSTPRREDTRDWLRPHDNDDGEWEARYGAGISLVGCRHATVSGCTVRGGQNGLLLTRCGRCAVRDNDFSFNSGWGIALYRSSDCDVLKNRCDWCVRGYSHGVYHRGQDSAGILLFEQCCRNQIRGNSATHGGDGLFLYAGHDTTERSGAGGSNDNEVVMNDFSHAVANGIEATFSQGNTFRMNDVSDSDHGLWLGYSSDTTVVDNRALGCISAGVSIEHGRGNRIEDNTIVGGRAGVHLWWDHDPAFVDGVFGKSHDTSSSGNRIFRNRIREARSAIRLVGDTGSEIVGNVLAPAEIALDLGKGTRDLAVEANVFQGAHGGHALRPTLVRNRTRTRFSLSGTNKIAGRFKLVPPRAGPNTVTLEDGTYEPQEGEPGAPDLDLSLLPKSMPRGRSEIRVDEWGPVHPLEQRVFPIRQSGGRELTYRVLGAGPFTVKADGPVTVEPAAGTAPATITVRAKAGSSGLLHFTLDVTLGDEHLDAAGLLVPAVWFVRFFEWTDDPREGSHFEELVKGSPKASLMLDALEFPWQSGGPDGLRRDRFATVAKTVLRLDAGRYRIRTVSDDGIRVYVDGTRVIDNWTHHAPTEDTADVALDAGKHDIRIEHFEIDGLAHLQFEIEPLR